MLLCAYYIGCLVFLFLSKELDDNDALGIRISMRHCLEHVSGVILMEHKVRIEDQAGWLIEKFFFKILQNVDMHAIMTEEKRRKSKDSRWICVPDEDLVNMVIRNCQIDLNYETF